jgi:class 3 adenylate cyclase
VACAAAASLAVTSVLRRRVLDPLESLSRGLDAVAEGRVDDARADVDAAHAPTSRPLREVDALVDAFDAMVRGVREREALVRRLEQGVGAQVASDPAALERAPRRQPVAVVVVDVRDFTPLQASLSPEVAGAFVDTLLSTFVDVVERHGGHVERFLGDGLIALFGAPGSAADHVARACACACDLEVAARHLVEASMQKGIPRFVIGVGVAAGTATVGAVGPPRRRIFQAMGDVPALARKVQQEAKNQGFGVLVTEEVAAAARDVVPGLTWKKLPPLVLRGVGMPVTLYRVERPARARDEVTALVDRRS